MRRIALAICLLVGLLLGVLLLGPAGAQTDATHTFVVSGLAVTPVNGNATIAIGQDDGVLGVECGGHSPRGGSVVPAIVITQPGATLTNLRIASWGTGTPVVNGVTVRINCSFEAQTATAVAAAKAKLHRLYPSAKIAAV
jgi:hypothetical protein